MKNEFNVIIAGSREFNDYELLKESCDFYLYNKLNDPNINVVIISGAARGADHLGEEYARERGLLIKKVPANWDKYGKSAGYIRNTRMAAMANAAIVFLVSDKECKGSKMMIDIARRNNLLVRVIEKKGE